MVEHNGTTNDQPTRRGFLKAVGAGTLSTAFGLSTVTTPAAGAPGGLTNQYVGDKAGMYYVRQVDDHPANNDQPLVFTYGETYPEEREGIPCDVPASANVFLGRRKKSTIKGQWVDVPKGVNSNYGTTYTLEIRDANTPESTKLQHTGGPGHNDTFTSLPITTCDENVCTAKQGLRRGNPPNVAAFQAWPGGARHGVTGTWRADDGGTYYIRQLHHDVFQNDTVVWFGEEAGTFTNVFWGTRNGDRKISGMWADVPKEGARNAGTLELEFQNDGTLRKTDQSGAIFGGQRWQRVSPTCEYDPDAEFDASDTGDEPDLIQPEPDLANPVDEVDPTETDVPRPSDRDRPRIDDPIRDNQSIDS